MTIGQNTPPTGPIVAEILLRIAVPCACLHASPSATAETTSCAVYGEAVRPLQERIGFVLVETVRDHYQGWIARNELTGQTDASTHVTCVRSAPMFLRPDIKAPIVRLVPLSSEVRVREITDKWAVLHDGTAMVRDHLQPLGWHLDDPVAVAETFFKGTPYVWGGKTPAAADCSGMVQTCFYLTGVQLPRDSGPQQSFLAKTEDTPKRGMVAGFKGHIGLMVDGTNMIHANATAMGVTVDPVDQIIEQIKGIEGPDSFNGFFVA